MEIKILLNEDNIPGQWYNLAGDLPPPWLRAFRNFSQIKVGQFE